MLSSVLLDLRRERVWDPSRLLADSFSWPEPSWPVLPLRDLATTIAPRSFVASGSEVITPASVDPRRIGVRRRSTRYQGSGYMVGAELQPGDLLVPALPTGPALMVSVEHDGAAVSSAFRALRPTGDLTLTLWVWAVLNSTSGQAARAAVAMGDAIPRLTRSALLEVAVPVPPIDSQRELRPTLVELERTTHIEEEEAPATWWRVTDLRNTEWRFETTVRDPHALEDGAPLGTLCGEIVMGQAQLQTAADEPADGLLPLTDIAVLGGATPRKWASPDERGVAVAYPGDLLVARIGERAQARVATDPSVVHSNVFLLRLRTPDTGPTIAAFLNSTEGFRLRQMFAAGSFIPSLRRSDLVRFPVPPRALSPHVEELALQQPLAMQLEHVLWQS